VTCSLGKTSKVAAVLRANPNQPQAAPAPRVATKSTVVRYAKSTHQGKPLAPGCAECEDDFLFSGMPLSQRQQVSPSSTGRRSRLTRHRR